jgi:hypothetical protein
VPRLAARLPDALVRLTPHRCGALGLRLRERPQAPRNPQAVAATEQDRVEGGTEDVVLPLLEGAVADPDGARAAVAGSVLAHRLGQIPATVDPIHDLEAAILVAVEVGHEPA